MAKESLVQWRRQHTRANIHELKDALSRMNRPDIIEEIDHKLKPKPKHDSRHRRRWKRVMAKNNAISQFVAMKPPKESRIARMMSAKDKDAQAQRDAIASEKQKEQEILDRKREKQKEKQTRIPALPKILVHN